MINYILTLTVWILFLSVPSSLLANPPYPTINMLDRYVGEEAGGGWLEGTGNRVRHVPASEIGRYRIVIKEGLLYDTEGRLLDTGGLRSLYIMDKNGEIYVSFFHERHQFHHSSLSRGLPVAAAGEIQILNGRVVFINNRSGHYKPGAEQLKNVVSELERKGVSIGEVQEVAAHPSLKMGNLEFKPNQEKTAKSVVVKENKTFSQGAFAPTCPISLMKLAEKRSN